MAAMEIETAAVFRLDERCVINISGADAADFLQNIVTQDIAGLGAETLRYGCLLTPQGRFLHDFFIFKAKEGFFLDVEAESSTDLVRRFKMFRLRSKVDIDETALRVYAGAEKGGAQSFPDPRLPALGARSYLTADEAASPSPSAGYKDKRISLGVPEGGGEIKPEIDTLSDVNLDRLHAVSWTKGCFVGQEVSVRMHNRGLIKKRLAIVAGHNLTAEGALTQGGRPVGEMRAVNSQGNEGLAILKSAALADESEPVTQPDGSIITAHFPIWLKVENS